MKTTLKIEAFFQFLLGIAIFSQLYYNLVAFPRNIIIAIIFLGMGYFFLRDFYILVGVLLFSYAVQDKVFGSGLKYPENFKHTHLGTIGKI